MSSFRKFAFFILFFSFFILLPEFSLVSAQQTQACNAFGIIPQILNQPDPIPEGLSSLQIKLTGLTEQGWYKLRIGRSFNPREFYSDTQASSNGEVTLTITDSNILSRNPYTATLEYSFDNKSEHTNTNYCNNITYIIGTSGICSLTTNPSPDKIQTNQQFTVTATQLPPNHYYVMDSLDLTGRKLSPLDINSQGTGTTTTPISFANPGKYTLYVHGIISGYGTLLESMDAKNWCEKSITVNPPTQPGDNGVVGCTLLTPDATSSLKEYKVSVFNLKADVMSPSATNRAYIATLSKDGGSPRNTDTKVIGLTDDSVEIALGNISDDGRYDWDITGSNGSVCHNTFTVKNGAPIGGGGGPAATPCTDPAKCTLGGGTPCGDEKDNPGISTAIGCIHTEPKALVKDFLTFATGISGGLAFLMMVLGAFQMLTSAGNPETLQTGRDRFTSAIIGLLIVIFAVLLLQIIGVDILSLEKIAGFGK